MYTIGPTQEGPIIQHTGTIGFRIFADPVRPDPSLVQQFAGLASSNLADAMGRFHFMDPDIRMRTGLPLCGVAVTVMARPADNLMVHKAMDVAHPGDIIVGDQDGAVVVPREDAEQVLSLVRALKERETRRVAEIRGGIVFKSEINDTLRAKGVV